MIQKLLARKKLFVDMSVQGALIGRTVFYWFACLVTITLMLLCWQIATGPMQPFAAHFDTLWSHNAPALAASLLLLPMVILDLLRLSNRFVGPLVRLRRSWKSLAAGEPMQAIHFRKGDYWQEFADAFNAAAARVQSLEARIRELEAARREEEPLAV